MANDAKAQMKRERPIAQNIIDNCHTIIIVMIVFTVVIGVFTGYYFHEGENEKMFVPLFVAFMTTFIAYMFIDLRSELVAERKDRALYLCDTYFKILIAATVVIGVFTGYFFHEGENENMFLPLFVAFITVISAYLFIEMKGELVADKLVDAY